jgi:hypothetical protein
MTQKAHEKEQPSWIFTNARVRSTRASARTHPIAPTCPATVAGSSSLCPVTIDTLDGIASNAPSRFAPQPVTKTRPWLRAARDAAWRDFEIASCVTQHVFTTATSAASDVSTWPSPSRCSRTACASAYDTLQPRKRTENDAIARLA